MTEQTTPRPLIAILRGIRPDEAVPIAQALVDAGIRLIEVPMNSPDPFDSIQRMIQALGAEAEIGGGTITSVAEVDRLANLGGSLAVSPNCDMEVIRRSKQRGLLSYPGVFTASECFTAQKSGADGLKLFPASMAGPGGLKALRSVLPPEIPFYAVGGVGPENFAEWLGAGAAGFGIGSSLYKPGASVEEVARIAKETVQAYDAARLALQTA